MPVQPSQPAQSVRPATPASQRKPVRPANPRLIWIMIGFCLFSISVAGFELLKPVDTGEILAAVTTTDPAARNGSQAGVTVASQGTEAGAAEPNQTGQADFAGDASQPGATGSPPAGQTSAADNRPVVPIYLVGAIAKPGIYEVYTGSYLYQLVDRAGGLTADAAADQINLAMQLNANQLIHIPTRAEWASAPTFHIVSDSTAAGETAKANINQADASAFDQLPGIGPSTAKAIIDYRTRNGPFTQLEDLMKIPGLKQSRFDAIRDLITLG